MCDPPPNHLPPLQQALSHARDMGMYCYIYIYIYIYVMFLQRSGLRVKDCLVGAGNHFGSPLKPKHEGYTQQKSHPLTIQEKGGPWGSCIAAGALLAIARSSCPGAKRAVRSRLHVALVSTAGRLGPPLKGSPCGMRPTPTTQNCTLLGFRVQPPCLPPSSGEKELMAWPALQQKNRLR